MRKIIVTAAGALAAGGTGELLAALAGTEAAVATAALAGAGAGWFALGGNCPKEAPGEAAEEVSTPETEQPRQEEESAPALYDAGAFDLVADKQVKLCRRNEWPAGFVLIEIDRWEELKRRYGMEAAERVIEYVGRVIGETIRESDVAGHLGEGKLAMLLAHCDLEDTRKVIHRIQSNILSNPLEKKGAGGTIPIPFSAGTVVLTGRVARYDLLLQRAAVALERARSMGGNRIESY